MPRTLDTRLSRLSDLNLFLVTLYGECRGEPVEGQIGVAHVIQNRVRAERWGASLRDVLSQWAQFSALWPTLSGGLNYQAILDLAGTLYRGETLIGSQGTLVKQLHWIVSGIHEGLVLDNTYGCTHYFSTYIPKPWWAGKPGVRMATYGRHEFWAGIP